MLGANAYIFRHQSAIFRGVYQRQNIVKSNKYFKR